jgi:hypothetical protein
MSMLRVRVVERSPKNKKFRNAESARIARDQEAAWSDLLKRHGVKPDLDRRSPFKQLKAAGINEKLSFEEKLGRLVTKRPSKGDPAAQLDKKFEEKITQYTGDEVAGIGMLHKSTGVPVMRDSLEYAREIAKMRR